MDLNRVQAKPQPKATILCKKNVTGESCSSAKGGRLAAAVMTGYFGSARFCDALVGWFTLFLRCLALAVVALQVFSTRGLAKRKCRAVIGRCAPPIIILGCCSFWKPLSSACSLSSQGIQKMLQADAKDFLMDCDPVAWLLGACGHHGLNRSNVPLQQRVSLQAIIGLSQSYVCEATKAFVPVPWPD